nr:zinc finger, CCHC-type [Tanacetum cinerariifolium]
MSVKYPNYVNLTSSSEEQPNERTHLPPPRKKLVSPPQAPSKSISSKSTHYTSSSSLSTGLMLVSQGVKFEVEPHEDHEFEVEPLRNVGQGVGLQKLLGWESSDDINDYYWKYTQGLLDEAKGNILGMEIFRIQSGNTLRVSQSRVYNGKLVQALLEGHFI